MKEFAMQTALAITLPAGVGMFATLALLSPGHLLEVQSALVAAYFHLRNDGRQSFARQLVAAFARPAFECRASDLRPWGSLDGCLVPCAQTLVRQDADNQ